MLKPVLLLLAIFISGTVSAACVKPAAPTLPDSDSAVTAQMVKAKNDVNAYLKNANAYLECVSGKPRKHNAQVKEMKKVGNEFNETVRSYKKRMADQ